MFTARLSKVAFTPVLSFTSFVFAFYRQFRVSYVTKIAQLCSSLVSGKYKGAKQILNELQSKRYGSVSINNFILGKYSTRCIIFQKQ